MALHAVPGGSSGGGGGSGWSKTGDSGTTAGTNFVGTTDSQDFVGKRNSTERLRLTSTGVRLTSATSNTAGSGGVHTLEIDASSGTYRGIAFISAGSAVAAIQGDVNGGISYYGNTVAQRFFIGSDELLTVNPIGVVVNGNGDGPLATLDVHGNFRVSDFNGFNVAFGDSDGIFNADDYFIYNSSLKLLGVNVDLATVNAAVHSAGNTITQSNRATSFSSSIVPNDMGYAQGFSSKSYDVRTYRTIGGTDVFSTSGETGSVSEPSASDADATSLNASFFQYGSGAFSVSTSHSYDVYAMYGGNRCNNALSTTITNTDADFSGNPADFSLSWTAPVFTPSAYRIIRDGAEYQDIANTSPFLTDTNSGWTSGSPSMSPFVWTISIGWSVANDGSDWSGYRVLNTSDTTYADVPGQFSTGASDNNTWAAGSIGASSLTTAALRADGNVYFMESYTPSSSSEDVEEGRIAWDANYIYVATTTNTWKRAALSTF